MPRVPGWGAIGEAIERWLEAERDQLPLWLPVIVGAGVAAWYLLPDPRHWAETMLAAVAVGLAALAVGRWGRAPRAVALAALSVAVGIGLVWWRAERVAQPVLARPTVLEVTGRVERAEPLQARGLWRITMAPQTAGLPPRIRLNITEADTPAGLTRGAVIKLKARLMPPPGASVPGAYDFARVAWFDGLGATGKGFAPVTVVTPGKPSSDLRSALTAHITSHLPGSAGGIAAALATGDMGAITQDDSDAMRKAGLAHLLSVSGLHITAAVGATMLVVLRLLALWPWLALRVRLPMVAALAGAAAAIGYTMLTGNQVPTIRSCVAALMVLAALALGREAMTMRLVAAGAIVVLIGWPEAMVGPSFQLSFAAIAAIIALHEHPWVARTFERHEENWPRLLLREAGSLLLTGIVVELALMPIAVFHFHKAGVYGAAVNIAAIPLTTFVVMPLEALALLFDLAGLGAPWWWLTGMALKLLLWMAHVVANAPGSSVALPAMPGGAYALMVMGGLWIALWRTRWRRLGVVPLAVGALWAMATPAPDLLVTGDGRHVAVRTAAGLVLLRDRAGDYTKDMLAENAGVPGEPLLMSDQQDARCSRDSCITDVRRRDRSWRVLAMRSSYPVPIEQLIKACAAVDIVVSERVLPRRCVPRWLKLDKQMLARTGGIAATLSAGRVITVFTPGDEHPWRDPPTVAPPRVNRSGAGSRRAYPGRGRDRADSAGDHRRDWPDRAGSSRPRGGNI